MNAHNILMSILYSLIACAFLPVLGRVIDLFVQYVIGGIITLFTRDYNKFVIFYNYLTFPGVIYHELSHAALAVITGAKVEHISLFRPHDGRLGEVEFRASGTAIMMAVQYALIACAPVITGMIGLYYFATYMITSHPSIPVTILLGYLMLCIFMHMTMSNEDLGLYAKGIWLFFILFFIGSMMMRT